MSVNLTTWLSAIFRRWFGKTALNARNDLAFVRENLQEGRVSDLYAEQMAEVAKVDVVIEGLRDEISQCRATVRGYREAAMIRDSILMWQDMRERMLAFAATVAPEKDAAEIVRLQEQSA